MKFFLRQWRRRQRHYLLIRHCEELATKAPGEEPKESEGALGLPELESLIPFINCSRHEDEPQTVL
jgi:hypothetical protein